MRGVPQVFVCEADHATLGLNTLPIGFQHAFMYICKKHALNVIYIRTSEVSTALCLRSTCGCIWCCAAKYPASTARDGRHSFNGRASLAITRATISAPVQAMICPIPLYSPVKVILQNTSLIILACISPGLSTVTARVKS